MTRYWRDSNASGEAFTADGWLRTGDVGCLDAAGRLHFMGRLKDMIKTGGENVHAEEVRRALLALPGVTDAAVVGVPHPRWGEAVAALIQGSCAELFGAPVACQATTSEAPHAPASRCFCNAAQVQRLRNMLVAHGLTAYKAPHLVVFAEEVPRSAMGKVQRGEVLEMLKLALSASMPSKL
jgi:acyl-CoA synthetase (AMP-forming)/AMP-acid ligase II